MGNIEDVKSKGFDKAKEGVEKKIKAASESSKTPPSKRPF